MLFGSVLIWIRFVVAFQCLGIIVATSSFVVPITHHTNRSRHHRNFHKSIIKPPVDDKKYRNNTAQSKVQDRLFTLYTTKPRRVDGRWSKWSAWSPCSRSCGGGVSIQSRQCVSRSQDSRSNRGRRRRRQHDHPSSGVNQCVGLYKRHQLCNDQPCPKTALDFRYEQCAAYNNRMFRGSKFLWEPFLEVPEECQLTCRPTGQDFYAILNRTVVDGTPCRRPLTVEGQPTSSVMRGICVEGKCRAVGTSGILGLDTTPRLHQVTHSEGGCPACDGPNSKCILMSFIFTQPQMAPGYAPVATIPKDACYINITQLRPTRNHLALRNPDGKYVLNGNWAINRNGIYDVAGGKFVYHRPDSPSSLESITSPGPTLHPIEIMLVYRVPNPGVKYEYKVPSGVPIPMAEEKIAPPSIDLRRLPTPSQADEAPRHPNRLPKSHRRKRYSWRISPSRTPCSKTCGGGVQSQIVICVRDSTQIPVHERRCIHSEKPDVVVMRCATQPCPAHWVALWSPCSVTCGTGEQRRLSLDCKQEINSKLTVAVNEGVCTESKPGAWKPCHLKECDILTTTMENDEISSNDLTQDASNYKYWRTGPWSQCSSTCDSGFRTRLVTCYGGVRPDDCPASQRPHAREHCENLPPCHVELTTKPASITSPSTSSWLYTEWSQNCDDDCGNGSQYRRVACLRSGDTCSNDLRPETRRSCSSDRHCGGKWYTGPWGRCIDPCSSSPIQKREVLCIVHVKGQSRIVTDRTCSISTKPESERRCHEIHCPAEWFVGDWDVCNATGPNSCENAIQRREVRCLDEANRDSQACDGDTPAIKRSCEPSFCNNQAILNRAAPGDQPILDSNCADKIDRCRTAVQARLCQYEYYKNKCCLSCSRAPELPRD